MSERARRCISPSGRPAAPSTARLGARRGASPGGRCEEDMEYQRLSMPIGEAMFTQRSIRRFRPDSIAIEDIRLILEAASKAPSGGNQQIARFLVVADRALIGDFGALYRESWWAKRRDELGWTGPQDVPA